MSARERRLTARDGDYIGSDEGGLGGRLFCIGRMVVLADKCLLSYKRDMLIVVARSVGWCNFTSMAMYSCKALAKVEYFVFG